MLINNYNFYSVVKDPITQISQLPTYKDITISHNIAIDIHDLIANKRQ